MFERLARRVQQQSNVRVDPFADSDDAKEIDKFLELYGTKPPAAKENVFEFWKREKSVSSIDDLIDGITFSFH